MGSPLLKDGTESETGFQGWLHERAAWAQWDTQYHTYNSEHSDEGFPDWFGIREIPGLTYRGHGPVYRYLVAELKSARGQVKARQALWLDRLASLPQFTVCLWRPGDKPEIERILVSNEPLIFTATNWLSRRFTEKIAKDPPLTAPRRRRSRVA